MLKTSKTLKAIGYLSLVAGAVCFVTCRGHVSLAICTAVFMAIIAVQDAGTPENKK